MQRHYFLALISVILVAISAASHAEDAYTLTLKGAKFEPSTLTLPADKKVKLSVVNSNKAPMEFESHDLKREKVIPAGGTAVISVGPLKAGSYGFFDEFQENEAKGTIVVK